MKTNRSINHNVLSLGLVADDSRPKPNKYRLIFKFKTNMDKDKTMPPLSQTAVSGSVIESQLRIGNCIQDMQSKRIGYVNAIKGKLAVKMEFSTLIQKAEEFEGVPITKETLLIFGIKKLQVNNIVVNDEQESYFIVEFEVFDNKYSIKSYYVLRFIHQLQNFYLDKTGLELTIVL